MDFNNFKTNVNKETDGVWSELAKGTRIKVARMNNAKYKKSLRKLMAPHKIAIRRNTMPDAVAETLLNRCIAETILLDWEGFQHDGEDVTYSAEKAFEILEDKELKDFRDYVVEVSEDLDLYKVEEDEEAIKN